MSAPSTLPVLRVRLAGTVTSFRYPHFVQGFQPTFEMPPPSTIYGHLCSAVGDYIPPASTLFGYHFVHSGKFIDFQEHLHFGDQVASGTKDRGAQSGKLDVQPFPFNRELLYNPVLTLYLTDLSLEPAFRSPRYPVILGRSQDLMTYTDIRVITLHRAETAYFEHTLLPLNMAPRLREATVAVTMPRYIDPRRRPVWGQYALLQRRALLPQTPQRDEWDDPDADGLIFEDDPVTLWVDPDTAADSRQPQARRAVWLHAFVDGDRA